jgi:two-component system, cell cycle sensor histidine kinase and response regulator CckA
MSSSTVSNAQILVVDDDDQLSHTLADILRLSGFRAFTESSAQGGLRVAEKLAPELAIALVDLRLPDMDGMELVERLHALSDLTEVVVLTGNASMESVLGALRQESFDYLIKPVDPERLIDTMSRATERWQRRVVEQRLHETEEKFRLVVENMSDMIFLLDEDTAVQYASPSAGRELGADPAALVGRPISDLVGPRDEMKLRPVLEGLAKGTHSGSVSIEHSFLRGYSDECHVESTVQCIGGGRPGFLISSRDIGERRRLEAELFQSRKMESVGRLAGGIAHDFNNLLTVVMGAGELCRLEGGKDSPQRHYVDEILTAAQRGSAMVRQLLAFSRRQVLVPRVVDLNALIEDASKLLRRMLGEDLELKIVLSPVPACVMADPGQMEQVLMNLAVNARDAMPRGGVITVRTRVGPSRHGESRVVVEVSDTGQGIPKDIIEEIFEPFFTTKELGRGTGLGLATALGIVQQSGGTIDVRSTPGKGSCFTIDLPQVDAVPELPSSRVSELHPTGAGETILLVEDEEPVRMIVTRSLERQGYRVLQARSGTEAAQILRDLNQRVDLLLSDVVLPGHTGIELAELGRRLRPQLRVLLSSGYSEEAISRRGELAQIPLLQKPFEPAQLLTAVRAVLDEDPLGSVAGPA